MPPLSVVICTHNPRPDYFSRCVDALRAQALPAAAWELLIVDNASAAGRQPQADLSWHPAARVIREETLGLTPARLRAIREAAGDLLVFVDDDNVLDPDFLETAAAIAREKPFLGAWSGQCRPEFEQTPPAWTRRYWGNLVIREFTTDVWSNLPRLDATMPCGAGLCVRRDVARRHLAIHEAGQRRVQLDRAGGSLLSGGDNDLAGAACDLGLAVGLMSALRLTHLIPPERLSADYLARLAEGTHFSAALLDAAYGIPVTSRGLAGRAVDLLRAMRLRQPHRRIFQASLAGRRKAERLLSSGAC